MRVISGKARGTKLNSIESNTTRPTLDRVKESLFNILHDCLNGVDVLDLFAGSGALGIEALSRGAKSVVFCDNNIQAIKMIKANLEKTRLLDKAQIINSDYKKCIEELKASNRKFNLIFIDPPYKNDIAVLSIKIILENKLLNNNGIIVIETDELNRDLIELDEAMKNSLHEIKIFDKRKYGRANLVFLKKECI